MGSGVGDFARSRFLHVLVCSFIIISIYSNLGSLIVFAAYNLVFEHDAFLCCSRHTSSARERARLYPYRYPCIFFEKPVSSIVH